MFCGPGWSSENRLYNWWRSRARNWRSSDRDRRFNHVLVTPPLVKRQRQAKILKHARDRQPASDHVPMVVALDA